MIALRVFVGAAGIAGVVAVGCHGRRRRPHHLRLPLWVDLDGARRRAMDRATERST